MGKSSKSKESDERKDVKAESGDEIRSTDVVFDCPHCGHNLCVDFHGAGLMLNCTECSKEVQVPIPEGMNVDDLDLTPEQALTQLFQTRRALARADKHIAELEEVVASLKERRSVLEKARMNTLHHYAELSSLCQAVQRSQTEISGVVNHMLDIIAAEQQH
jgi:transcription elongation factor Elf1